jgi:hypothetical protein
MNALTIYRLVPAKSSSVVNEDEELCWPMLLPLSSLLLRSAITSSLLVTAKITQLQVSIPGQQQVCRLDVTMHLLPLRQKAQSTDSLKVCSAKNARGVKALCIIDWLAMKHIVQHCTVMVSCLPKRS